MNDLANGPAHEVSVWCTCADVEHCRTELYFADVRLAMARIQRLLAEQRMDRWLLRKRDGRDR